MGRSYNPQYTSLVGNVHLYAPTNVNLFSLMSTNKVYSCKIWIPNNNVYLGPPGCSLLKVTLKLHALWANYRPKGCSLTQCGSMHRHPGFWIQFTQRTCRRNPRRHIGIWLESPYLAGVKEGKLYNIVSHTF